MFCKCLLTTFNLFRDLAGKSGPHVPFFARTLAAATGRRSRFRFRVASALELVGACIRRMSDSHPFAKRQAIREQDEWSSTLEIPYGY